MSQFYLIDGYNLLHAMGALKGRTGPHGLEKARSSLIARLHAALGDAAGAVTIVFDSSYRGAMDSSALTARGIEILFAVTEDEADDLIETLIAKHSSPKQLVVVSDDRRLKTAATRRKAQSMSCEPFLDFLSKRRNAPPPQTPEKPAADLGDTEYWMEQFGDLDSNPEVRKMLDPREVDGPP